MTVSICGASQPSVASKGFATLTVVERPSMTVTIELVIVVREREPEPEVGVAEVVDAGGSVEVDELKKGEERLSQKE